MTPTLVIMAAGNSTRYGALKQFENVGLSNACLFEYAIYDAIEAGFKRVIFIIKKEYQKYFTELKKKLSEHIQVEFAFQLINSHEKSKNKNRSKPWGTGHALLSCKKLINEPFVLMNADDYYGKSVFKLIFNELYYKQDHQLMIGYEMGKTLSKNGSVNRGICAIDKSNFLVKIEEKEDLNYIDYHQSRSIVSMNFWGLHAGIFEELEKRFLSFLDNCSDEINDEFFLPSFINEIILERVEKFKVIQTDEQWFGLTHNSDKLLLDEFLLNKAYPKELWKN
jgi:UTP-glucose-1-phosphate uridylyltransferase